MCVFDSFSVQFKYSIVTSLNEIFGFLVHLASTFSTIFVNKHTQNTIQRERECVSEADNVKSNNKVGKKIAQHEKIENVER